jgi:hypothetical protein
MIEKSLKSLLNYIIALKPPKREAIAKPALKAFILHLIIQPLLVADNAPAHKSILSKPPDLSDIQKTLTLLAKALKGI